MLSSDPLIVVGIFFLILFFSALLYGLLIQRRRGDADRPVADWVGSLNSQAPEAGERIASPISEAIEAMVQDRMREDPAFKDQRIDFGSSPDGTLEIWINDERYSNVDAIPNENIRTIIQEAVRAYNQGDVQHDR